MLSEFVPSLRLLVAFQQHPKLFQAFRNANRTYFKGGTKALYDDKYKQMSDARVALQYQFPVLVEELKQMEYAWDRVDQKDLDDGKIY